MASIMFCYAATISSVQSRPLARPSTNQLTIFYSLKVIYLNTHAISLYVHTLSLFFLACYSCTVVVLTDDVYRHSSLLLQHKFQSVFVSTFISSAVLYVTPMGSSPRRAGTSCQDWWHRLSQISPARGRTEGGEI